MAKKRFRYFNKQPQIHETNGNATSSDLVKGTPNNGHAAGLIYTCDESTIIDCFKYRVIGLSKKQKYLMDMITNCMCLFLFDLDSKLLYGIYTASSCSELMLEPDAFGGNYPMQVKFHIVKDCLPLREDVFRVALKDNYLATGKFKTMLNAKQVQKLVSLFSPLPGGPLKHPRANAPYHCVTPFTNAPLFVETSGHIQDRGYIPPRPTYAANKVDGFNQRDALPELNHRSTQPFTNAITTDSCMHGLRRPGAKHGILPPAPPACEVKVADKFIQSNPILRLNHEPVHSPNDAVTTEKLMHGYHASQAKHGSFPPTLTIEANKANEFTPLPRINCEPTKACMKCYHAPTAQKGFLPPMLTCDANKADTSIHSAPLPRINHHERMHPLNDRVITEKCIHDYHAPTARHGFLPPMLACEANEADGNIQSAPLLRLSHEHMHLFDNPAVLEKCMHGDHAPNKADGVMVGSALPILLNYESTHPLNVTAMTVKCMQGYHASTAKHGFVPPTSTSDAHKADVFLRNDPLPRLNHDPTHPHDDAVMTEKCVHGYHQRPQAKYNFPLPSLTCEAIKPDGLMQSALPKLNHEPKYPLNEVVIAGKCMHNYLAPTTEHGHKCAAAGSHQQCEVERDDHTNLVFGTSPIQGQNHADPLSGPLCALCATSELQNTKPNQIRTWAELYSGDSASYVNSSVAGNGYHMPNALHGIFLERKLHDDGEPMGVSSLLCYHAKIVPKGPCVFNAVPGQGSIENLHKRPFQDTYIYAPSDAARSVFDTSRERPLKCMHHEVSGRPIDDTFAGAVDGVPQSRHYIGCG